MPSPYAPPTSQSDVAGEEGRTSAPQAPGSSLMVLLRLLLDLLRVDDLCGVLEALEAAGTGP